MTLPAHPFRLSDLPELGLTAHALRRLVAAGTVRRVMRGVYVDAAIPDSIELRARALMLVLPASCVVSDRSAAWLHGVDAFAPGEARWVPAVEVVSAGGGRTRRAGTHGGKRTLTPSEVRSVEGVTVTSPLRTAVDLGRLHGRSGAFAAMCMLARETGVTGPQIVAAATRLAGHRGVIQLRELAPHVSGVLESPGEAWTLLALVDAGLPLPELQLGVWADGWGDAWLDLAYPLEMIAIEYDGEEFHTGEEDRERDAVRREALRRAGWTVIVVTKDMLGGKALLDWLAEVSWALEEARRRPARRYARASRPRRTA